MQSTAHKYKKHIVVVGGGFAGLRLMKGLANHPDYELTLVDRNNYHFFPPLIYQVATAFIEPANISYPFRRLFQKKQNLRFHMGMLQEVFPDEKRIQTSTGDLNYDYLVIAIGTMSNYFGLKNVEKNAIPMKTINDALNMRNHLLLNMEKAVREKDIKEKVKYLNIVIAGGGPTGVEIAGMLSELSKNIAAKEYPEIQDLRAHIHLIDAAPSLLGPMSKKAQKEAEDVLLKLGVKIKLNTAVKDYENHLVTLSDGSQIFTNMLIWTSGVIGRPVPGLPDEKIGKGRRIKVDAYNQVIGMDGIYAIGDICLQETDPNYKNGHPQLAQVAIQQAELLVQNFKNKNKNKALKAFQYKDKGSMAIISKYNAVADLPNFSIKGLFAWLIWLFIHIIPLVGFSNKIKLAFSWFAAFITNNPTLRLIIRPGQKCCVHEEP